MCALADFKEDAYCRICLQDLEGETNWSIFMPYMGKKILEHLKIITNIDVSKSFTIPNSQYVCHSCYEECKVVINFKNKCEETNLQLQKQTKVHIKKELKIEFEEDSCGTECYLQSNHVEFDSSSQSKQEVADTQSLNDKKVKKENLVCKNCTKRFEDTCELDAHIILCRLNFQCDDCGSFFKTKCKLKMHWKKEHLKNKLFCQRCKRHFKSFKALHSHKNRKACLCLDEQWIKVEGEDKKRVFCCKKCNFKSSATAGISSTILNHIRSHRGDKPFKCSYCNLSFVQVGVLKTHEAYIHKMSTLPSLQCEECGKTIIGKQRLQRHMSFHSSPMQKCSICNKMIQKRGFNMHMLRHENVKSFVCEICAVSYYTLSELCNHRKRAHSEPTHKVTHSCDICGYVSFNKYAIKSHIQKHSKLTHACGICGKFLNNELRLAKHKMYHERGRIYKCDYCDHSYFTSKAKSNHVNKKHSNIH